MKKQTNKPAQPKMSEAAKQRLSRGATKSVAVEEWLAFAEKATDEAFLLLSLPAKLFAEQQSGVNLSFTENAALRKALFAAAAKFRLASTMLANTENSKWAKLQQVSVNAITTNLWRTAGEIDVIQFLLDPHDTAAELYFPHQQAIHMGFLLTRLRNSAAESNGRISEWLSDAPSNEVAK